MLILETFCRYSFFQKIMKHLIFPEKKYSIYNFLNQPIDYTFCRKVLMKKLIVTENVFELN